MRHKRSDNQRHRAVTLVELVVAVSMMTAIFMVVVPVFAGIRNSWDTSRGNAEIVQQSRVLIDHLQRQLVQAAQVADVSSAAQETGHIVFTADDGTDYRYALSDEDYVQFGPDAGGLADLAGPVSRFQVVCYDGNDFETPIDDPASIRFITVEIEFPNSAVLGQDKGFKTSVYLRPSGQVDTLKSGVAVRDAIAWGGNGTDIDSYHSSQGAYNPANPGAEAIVSVNATGYGSITLWTQTNIRGDAYVGPGGDPDVGIKTWGGADITGTRGTLNKIVDMTTASAPSEPPFDGPHEGSLVLWGSNTETINSDRYFNKLQLWSNSKLIVDGDVTVVLNGSLQMSSTAEIQILPDSSLTMYIKGSLGAWSSAKLNDSTRDPSRLHIFMVGTNNGLDLGGDVVVYAVVENPTGRVNLWSDAQIFGKVRAAQLSGGGRIHVDLDCAFGASSE